MDIGLGLNMTAAALQDELSAIFGGCSVNVVEDSDLGNGPLPDGEVFVLRTTSPSEFPTGISVHASLRAGVDQEAWLREIARALAERLATRTIIDGTSFGAEGYPYSSLVWDVTTPYLADDLDTRFADGEGGPVKLIRELPLTVFEKRLDLASSVVRSPRAQYD